MDITKILGIFGNYFNSINLTTLESVYLYKVESVIELWDTSKKIVPIDNGHEVIEYNVLKTYKYAGEGWHLHKVHEPYDELFKYEINHRESYIIESRVNTTVIYDVEDDEFDEPYENTYQMKEYSLGQSGAIEFWDDYSDSWAVCVLIGLTLYIYTIGNDTIVNLEDMYVRAYNDDRVDSYDPDGMTFLLTYCNNKFYIYEINSIPQVIVYDFKTRTKSLIQKQAKCISILSENDIRMISEEKGYPLSTNCLMMFGLDLISIYDTESEVLYDYMRVNQTEFVGDVIAIHNGKLVHIEGNDYIKLYTPGQDSRIIQNLSTGSILNYYYSNGKVYTIYTGDKSGYEFDYVAINDIDNPENNIILRSEYISYISESLSNPGNYLIVSMDKYNNKVTLSTINILKDRSTDLYKVFIIEFKDGQMAAYNVSNYKKHTDIYESTDIHKRKDRDNNYYDPNQIVKRITYNTEKHLGFGKLTSVPIRNIYNYSDVEFGNISTGGEIPTLYFIIKIKPSDLGHYHVIEFGSEVYYILRGNYPNLVSMLKGLKNTLINDDGVNEFYSNEEGEIVPYINDKIIEFRQFDFDTIADPYTLSLSYDLDEDFSRGYMIFKS